MVFRRWVSQWWLLAIVAVGLAMTGEAVYEVFRYTWVTTDHADVSSYYDTIAAIGMTGVGAVLGAIVGIVISDTASNS